MLLQTTFMNWCGSITAMIWVSSTDVETVRGNVLDNVDGFNNAQWSRDEDMLGMMYDNEEAGSKEPRLVFKSDCKLVGVVTMRVHSPIGECRCNGNGFIFGKQKGKDLHDKGSSVVNANLMLFISFEIRWYIMPAREIVHKWEWVVIPTIGHCYYPENFWLALRLRVWWRTRCLLFTFTG